MADSAKGKRKERKEKRATVTEKSAAVVTVDDGKAGDDGKSEETPPADKSAEVVDDACAIKKQKKKRRKLRRLKLEQQIATGANALALQKTKDPLQQMLDKELATQQTVIPDIEESIMALIKKDPARAFMHFIEALTQEIQ